MGSPLSLATPFAWGGLFLSNSVNSVIVRGIALCSYSSSPPEGSGLYMIFKLICRRAYCHNPVCASAQCARAAKLSSGSEGALAVLCSSFAKRTGTASL